MEQIGFHDMRSLLQKEGTEDRLMRLERMITNAHKEAPERVREEWWPYARSILARSWSGALIEQPFGHALTQYTWPGVDAVLGSFHEIDARASGRRGRLRLSAANATWRQEIIEVLDALPEATRDREHLVGALVERVGEASKSKAPAVLELLGAMGPLAASAQGALLEFAQSSDKRLRKVAYEAIGEVGGDVDLYAEHLLGALEKGDKLAAAAFANLAPEAGEIIRSVLLEGSNKAKRAAYEAMVVFAPVMDVSEWEEEILEVLEHDNESVQQLGVDLVIGLAQPPESLLESVADLSSFDRASAALRKFRYEALRAELPSLLKSGMASERLVGLEIVRHHGGRAEEFAPRVAKLLESSLDEETTIAALHVLAKVTSEEEMGAVFAPALDHWSKKVKEVAREYLDEANVPVRASKWEGHPFSTSLLRQLMRLGFEPKEGVFNEIPEDRPLPEMPLEEGSERPESWSKVNMSEAMWALLNALEQPSYELYTVWGSNENMDTFYFEGQSNLFGRSHRKGEVAAPMYVIGDGSIGYYAALDLSDTSDDPSLYYIERWSGWGSEDSWRVSYSLSRYLRQLGTRR